jgi:transcriptional regulator of acetoin/glycerol metabolism
MVQPVGHTLTEDAGQLPSGSRTLTQDSLYLLLEGDRPSASSCRYSLGDIASVVIGRGAKRSALRPAQRRSADLQVDVPDPRMSTNHAILTRAGEHWALADCSSRNGTRVNGEAVTSRTLEDGDLLEFGRTVFLFREGVPAWKDADADLEGLADDPFQTLNREFAQELEQLKRIAPAREIAILIRGESGTGKELLARRIAEWAKLPGDFVAVNCGALPNSLLEAELFGSLRGAYSGATSDRVGLIRSADKGCLFLDEIAELNPTSQAALLRVLQEREVLPVGATRPIPVTLRLLSATHQDLDAAVFTGQFRQDLLARVAGFRVSLPALRDRKEDLGILIASILARLDGAAADVHFAPEVIRSLYHYDWPSNVRELANTLRTAILLADGDTISPTHLRDVLETKIPPSKQLAEEPLSPEQVEQRGELVSLLTQHQGNVSAVARDLGKARMQIQRWMKRYGLNSDNFRS